MPRITLEGSLSGPMPLLFPVVSHPYDALAGDAQHAIPYLVKPVACSCHCGHDQAWALQLEEQVTVMVGCCHCTKPPSTAKEMVEFVAMHSPLRLEEWLQGA